MFAIIGYILLGFISIAVILCIICIVGYIFNAIVKAVSHADYNYRKGETRWFVEFYENFKIGIIPDWPNVLDLDFIFNCLQMGLAVIFFTTIICFVLFGVGYVVSIIPILVS